MTREYLMPIDSQQALELVTNLCGELDASKIIYCHWKSNANIDRSASGENDLDLLISRSSAQQFTDILFRLGFKQAFDMPEWQLPGVLDYYGYDQAAKKFVHVHAHYQLIMGHDATKNYRLPIEDQYLESIVQDGLFKVPAPEFEYIVLVIRLMIKHCTWDVMLIKNGRISDAERKELAFLQDRISQSRMIDILRNVFPYLDVTLFSNCVQSLSPKCSLRFRLKTGEELRRKLRVNSRRSWGSDIVIKLWRRLADVIQRHVFRASRKKYLANGGLMIALIGGDGSGKTTAINGLYAWLSREFEVKKLHMGKPPWSLSTIVIRVILKIGRLLGLYPFVKEGSEYSLNTNSPSFPGIPWLIREVCTAHDRYLVYTRGRRFATNGGLVLCDRFPVPAIKIMDGPQVERVTSGVKTNKLIRFLGRLEKHYYDQISLPDLLITLRVDPEISVQRKTDETPDSVRSRAQEIWNVDWSKLPVHIIDASKTKTEVLSDLMTLLWSYL
jgi:thymidylate kinase